jgi:Fic family protein
MFQPIFTITSEINRHIAEIERLRAIVDQAFILPELEVQLRFRATVEAVHGSTSIEGNPLNELQVKRVLQGQTITAPDYAIIEILNYKRALDWLNKKEHINKKIATADILELHGIVTDKLLPKEKSGSWRPGNVYVIDEINGKEIVRYTGPDAKKVPKLVKSFLQWISIQRESKLHPILLAGIIHYVFVSIHPFSDGNGRTTRLLTHHFLKEWKYDFRGSLSLDSFYLQQRNAYYTALSRGETFDDRMLSDITPFLDFFTKGFLAAAINVSQYIKIGKVVSEHEKTLRLDVDELAILDFTYQFRSISIQEAMDVLLLPKRTVQRRLMELVEKEILTIEGQGPSTHYILKSKRKKNIK